MSYPYSAEFRASLADRCDAFERTASDDPTLKRSAVAIVLVDAGDGAGETAFLLTKRTPRLRAHAGQWALPGGRCDEDETLTQTALRELEEELGLTIQPADVLGVLDDYVSRSGYAIAPVVVWLEDTSAMTLNPDEVASVHRFRLDHIGGPEAVEFLTIPESDRPVIRMRIGERFVHAPTAALVYQLSELAADRVTRVVEFEQPVFAWQ